MKLYLLVTADELELPLACERYLANFSTILNTKSKSRQRIAEWLTRAIDKPYEIRTPYGKARLRTVNISISLDDIYYTLQHDNSFLTDTYTVLEICEALNLSPRTYFRHQDNPKWLLSKCQKHLNNLKSKGELLI